jgi:hypothetical protein
VPPCCHVPRLLLGTTSPFPLQSPEVQLTQCHGCRALQLGSKACLCGAVGRSVEHNPQISIIAEIHDDNPNHTTLRTWVCNPVYLASRQGRVMYVLRSSQEDIMDPHLEGFSEGGERLRGSLPSVSREGELSCPAWGPRPSSSSAMINSRGLHDHPNNLVYFTVIINHRDINIMS